MPVAINAQGEKIAIGELTPAVMLDILRSTECYCGAFKRKWMSHCFEDYKRLPRELAKGLSKRSGQGYEEAYVASLEWLRDNAK